MNKLFLALPLSIALAACGSEPAAEPAPVETATPEPVASLPAPNMESFGEAFAKACPDAEEVSTALCKRGGIGSTDVFCDYGLGEDEYRRHTATLTPGEGEWVLAEPEKVCAEHGAHHSS